MYLTLHSDMNTERIDNSQEIEVWPEMCVKIPQIDCMYPVWLVGCFGFHGPLRQYFSLYRAVSQREGDIQEKR